MWKRIEVRSGFLCLLSVHRPDSEWIETFRGLLRSMPASCFFTVLYAQAMRGVLWAMPKWPSGLSTMMPPWPFEALLQIVHRFLRGPLGQIAGLNAVGGPLRED